MPPIHDPEAERVEREQLRFVQLERLQATLNRAYRHVTLYREAFDRAGLLPQDVRSLEDLARLPFTTRADLLSHQPYGLFAVALHEVLRLHPAAGAGGPIMVGYTRNDIAAWTRMSARALAAAGVAKDDVVQISLDYALDAAATGAQNGAEALGAGVIPSSGLAPQRQAEIMRLYRATVLVATPAQAIQIGRAVETDAADLSLRAVLLLAEVWSEDRRREIEDRLRAPAFVTYGLSEMAVPGLATECERRAGLHLSENDVVAEVVDPETGEPLALGETGELVLTTLTREAVPMLRYRTGDLTRLDASPCACGRTLMRMEPPAARADDMLMIDGRRVWPEQVREIVWEFMPGAPCAVAAAPDGGALEVRVELDPQRFADVVGRLENLRDHIRTHLLDYLKTPARVRLVEPGRRGCGD